MCSSAKLLIAVMLSGTGAKNEFSPRSMYLQAWRTVAEDEHNMIWQRWFGCDFPQLSTQQASNRTEVDK